MKYLQALIVICSILQTTWSSAETVYISVAGMNGGSSILEVDNTLNLTQRFNYPGSHIQALQTTSADKQYIYGIANDGLLVFDRETSKFIYRNSGKEGIYPEWIFLAQPTIEKKEWLHIVNNYHEFEGKGARYTLIALEKDFFSGDEQAKSSEYFFDDYPWNYQVIESMVADPKDNQRFFLVLSGSHNQTGQALRDIIEMRFNETEKKYELVRAVAFDYPDQKNRVSKAIIRPQGDWIYLQLNSVTPSIIMVNTSDLSQHKVFLTDNLKHVALSQDGDMLLASYSSYEMGGLKTFTHINDPEKFKLKEDSITPTYSYEGSDLSYSHERILTDKINYSVPEYFSLANNIGAIGPSIYEVNAKVSNMRLKNNKITRGEIAPLIAEDDNYFQFCLTSGSYCLTDTLAFSYAKGNNLYTAKTFYHYDRLSSILLTKTNLKTPADNVSYVMLEEGVSLSKRPTSILVIE
jgi:hypothetical protein